MSEINFNSLVISDEIKGIAKVAPGQFILNTATGHSYTVELPDDTLTVDDIRAYCELCSEGFIKRIPFILALPKLNNNKMDFSYFSYSYESISTANMSRSFITTEKHIVITGYLSLKFACYEELDINVKEGLCAAIQDLLNYFRKRKFLNDDSHFSEQYQSSYECKKPVFAKIFKIGEKVPYQCLEDAVTNSDNFKYDMTKDDLFNILNSYFKVFNLLNSNRQPRNETDGLSSHVFHNLWRSIK